MVLIEYVYTCTFIIFVGLLLVFTNVKIKIREFFMLGGLIFLALKSNRHESLLIPIGIIYFMQIFNRFIYKVDPNGSNSIIRILNKKIIAFSFIFIIISYSILNYKIVTSKYDYINVAYPVDASIWIKNNLDLSSIRLYNQYGIGSYLLFKDIPVFIDSRADLYTKEFNKMEYSILDDDFEMIYDVNSFFKKYKLTHVLVENNAVLKFVIENRENYKELYSDAFYTIYEIN